MREDNLSLKRLHLKNTKSGSPKPGALLCVKVLTAPQLPAVLFAFKSPEVSNYISRREKDSCDVWPRFNVLEWSFSQLFFSQVFALSVLGRVRGKSTPCRSGLTASAGLTCAWRGDARRSHARRRRRRSGVFFFSSRHQQTNGGRGL